MTTAIFNLIGFLIQPATEGPPPPDPGNHGPDGAQLPIDSSLWILLIIGLLLGLIIVYRKIRISNKAA